MSTQAGIILLGCQEHLWACDSVTGSGAIKIIDVGR